MEIQNFSMKMWKEDIIEYDVDIEEKLRKIPKAIRDIIRQAIEKKVNCRSNSIWKTLKI